jgi:hypothetical protein
MLVKYSKNNQKCKKTQIEVPKKILSDSIFSFSDLDSTWPDYKNSLIFIQGLNQKFKFVLQCYQLTIFHRGARSLSSIKVHYLYYISSVSISIFGVYE